MIHFTNTFNSFYMKIEQLKILIYQVSGFLQLGCYLGELGIDCICCVLPELCFLRKLDLSCKEWDDQAGNNIGIYELMLLGNCIVNLKNIDYLNLFGKNTIINNKTIS